MAVLAVALLGIAPASADAKKEKVTVCHSAGTTFHGIQVSTNALPAHRGHGDALPGEAVPGQVDHVFDADCGVVYVAPPPTCAFAGAFDGQWGDGFNLTSMSTSGSTVFGQWLTNGRADFSGPLSSDGCSVTMTFPDDATYLGTLTSPCRIVWSVPGTTPDPASFWAKAGCA